jgi:dUTP pyrophosphatase
MYLNVEIDKDCFLPSKAYPTDAGFDLKSPIDCVLKANKNVIINTGVHIQLPKNYAGLIVSKSGLNVKNNIISTGLIDEGYNGPIIIKLYNLGNEDYIIKRGDKISQIVIIKNDEFIIKEVDKIEGGERGENGFGSSGK